MQVSRNPIYDFLQDYLRLTVSVDRGWRSGGMG